MKRNLALVFGVLLLAATAQAAVTVEANGKTTNYNNGSAVSVTGNADTTVTYNGVKVFIPKGVKVTVKQAANGDVTVEGSNFTGVKINNATVHATGNASFSVNPNTQLITVNQGYITVTDANGKTAGVAKGATVSAKNVLQTSANTASEEVPAFVAETAVSSTASQQATQNVYESETLSPSAPR